MLHIGHDARVLTPYNQILGEVDSDRDIAAYVQPRRLQLIDLREQAVKLFHLGREISGAFCNFKKIVLEKGKCTQIA